MSQPFASILVASVDHKLLFGNPVHNWKCHRTTGYCTGLLCSLLWSCVTEIGSNNVKLSTYVDRTSDPLGMFINGAWMWMALYQVSLLAENTLATIFGSRNMYFHLLSTLFWGNFGTQCRWLLSSQQTSTLSDNTLSFLEPNLGFIKRIESVQHLSRPWHSPLSIPQRPMHQWTSV